MRENISICWRLPFAIYSGAALSFPSSSTGIFKELIIILDKIGLESHIHKCTCLFLKGNCCSQFKNGMGWVLHSLKKSQLHALKCCVQNQPLSAEFSTNTSWLIPQNVSKLIEPFHVFRRVVPHPILPSTFVLSHECPFYGLLH